MTDIEQKALALVNEVAKVRGHTGSPWNSPTILNEALYRAIQQHEAFRQEVSDAVENTPKHMQQNFRLSRFILPKPDPLVEAFDVVWPGIDKAMVEALRAAIEKRGGKIVWGEG